VWGLPIKTWKIRPPHFTILTILKKKGSLTDTELFEVLSEEFEDLGFKDFNELLMRLEVRGKIRTTSLVKGKKRIELIT
jgi:hypothetical protein